MERVLNIICYYVGVNKVVIFNECEGNIFTEILAFVDFESKNINNKYNIVNMSPLYTAVVKYTPLGVNHHIQVCHETSYGYIFNYIGEETIYAIHKIDVVMFEKTHLISNLDFIDKL